eukprot:XP_012817267.1 PREDICTED: inactive serine protease PAMR1 [Xenopus tropicalis]
MLRDNMALLVWSSLVVASLHLLGTAAYPSRSKYTVINENCPGAEWNIMCRDCCEYDQVECACPDGNQKVGYTIPCCRNEENECDSCLIHPGCSIFENCKSCNNGSWGGTLDDFYIKGSYCSECRMGWYGGDCMRCGEVIQAARGEIMLESYPFNARCEWSIQVAPGYTVELRFGMLSLEFDYMCQYDYLEVRDGDNVDAKILKRFCGNQRPLSLRSTGNSLHLLFQSDGSKNFDGFYVTFEEVTGCSSTPCFHDGTCIADKTGSYRCACLAGYTGRHCENVIEEKSCKDPGAPMNGYRKLPDGAGLSLANHIKVGFKIHYFCNNSYVLSGNQERACLQGAQWSGKQPVCIKGAFCGKLENFNITQLGEQRWPWQAALYRRSNGVKDASLRKGSWVLVCSGALLNERTVVMAAHCVTDLGKSSIIKVSDMKVVLGKFYRDDDREEKSQQHLHISAVIVNPNYDPILLDSDIAVIKLLDKARVSDYVQPVCLTLATEMITSPQEYTIVISGWKILSDPRAPGSKNETIRAGAIEPVDSLQCEQQYEENGISVSVTESMFCAKQEPRPSPGICPSETGGITTVLLPSPTSPEGSWHLIGLVSWGYDKSCRKDLYTGYTKVVTFKEWLEKNMK